MARVYDLIVIGAGPAGLTAGLYACRAGLDTLLAERSLCGGQMLIADLIENFPGFPKGVRGPELAEWMYDQASAFGLKTEFVEVVNVSRNGITGSFLVKFSDGKTAESLSLVVATGARWNHLGVPGEERLAGKGVSYCATCDGPLFKGKKIAVVGGGDTALGDAIFLTKFAEKVTVIHRRNVLRATRILQDRARANKKIEFCLNSVVVEILGENKVSAIKTKDSLSGKEKIISCDGVFIFIGITPNSDPVKSAVKTNEAGYILVDDDMRTSTEGIFACGDVRKKTLRQVVTATGDGATAAFSSQHYVDRIKGNEYPGLRSA